MSYDLNLHRLYIIGLPSMSAWISLLSSSFLYSNMPKYSLGTAGTAFWLADGHMKHTENETWLA